MTCRSRSRSRLPGRGFCGRAVGSDRKEQVPHVKEIGDEGEEEAKGACSSQRRPPSPSLRFPKTSLVPRGASPSRGAFPPRTRGHHFSRKTFRQRHPSASQNLSQDPSNGDVATPPDFFAQTPLLRDEKRPPNARGIPPHTGASARRYPRAPGAPKAAHQAAHTRSPSAISSSRKAPISWARLRFYREKSARGEDADNLPRNSSHVSPLLVSFGGTPTGGGGQAGLSPCRRSRRRGLSRRSGERDDVLGVKGGRL